MIIRKPVMPSAVIIFQISSLSEIKMVSLNAADTICLIACSCAYEFLRDEQERVQRSTAFHLIYQIQSVHIEES